MPTFDSYHDLFTEIAKAADYCFKPWLYSVVDSSDNELVGENLDFVLLVQCRNKEGERHPENDLELEIYRSGSDVNVMVSWYEKKDLPILWHGKYSVWMNPESGRRCQAPDNGSNIESFVRRLKVFLEN